MEIDYAKQDWYVSGSGEVANAETGETICRTIGITGEREKAHCRFIATAPIMLSICKKMLKFMNDSGVRHIGHIKEIELYALLQEIKGE